VIDGSLAECWHVGRFVFARHADTFTSAWRALTAQETGTQIRFLDLRHTHASQLLKAGVPVKVVSERLGHATASITLDVYSHVLPGMQEAAVEKIDAMLGKAVGE
jgi:integrase